MAPQRGRRPRRRSDPSWAGARSVSFGAPASLHCENTWSRPNEPSKHWRRTPPPPRGVGPKCQSARNNLRPGAGNWSLLCRVARVFKGPVLWFDRSGVHNFGGSLVVFLDLNFLINNGFSIGPAKRRVVFFREVNSNQVIWLVFSDIRKKTPSISESCVETLPSNAPSPLF